MANNSVLSLTNLGEEFSKLYNSIQQSKNVMTFGATFGNKMHITSNLDRFVLYVTADKISANYAKEKLEEYLEDVAMLPEKDDVLIYRQAYHELNSISRLQALAQVMQNKVKALVMPCEALIQYLPYKTQLKNRIFNLVEGEEYDIEQILAKLVEAGYKRAEQLEDKGTFNCIGDIISIFPIDAELPVRLSFFDTQLESIKQFEPDSMMTVRKLKEISIIPCGEYCLTDAEKVDILQKLEACKAVFAGSALTRIEAIIEEINFKFTTTNQDASFVWLLPFLKQKSTIFDYLPKDTVIVFEESKVIEDKLKLYANEHKSRVKNFVAEGEAVNLHKLSIIDRVVLQDMLKPFTKLAFMQISSSCSLFEPQELYNIKSLPLTLYHQNYNALVADIKGFRMNKTKVILCCGDRGIASNIEESLRKYDVTAELINDVPADFNGVAITDWKISKGFIVAGKLALIGKEELIKKVNTVSSYKKRSVFTMPQKNDYVVHEDYGIGLCLGIERIKTSIAEKDYVAIGYQDGTLYVPIDQMDRVQRYSGSDVVPRLSKMQGNEFLKVKDKVRNSIKAMAFDLLEVYKKRHNSKGVRYDEDTIWQREFEESFEFTETPDQLRSVAEIKADMESGIIMDRLLCGDVGYGKTEVALRAVFKTIMQGKQAAILAPTTLLARQHFNTALSRFNEFKLKCALLSRFQTKEEIEQSKQKIKSGEINLIVATHRMLSKDIEFNDLGLLVLDEEQRFGVEHKEKIKLLKNNINVLSMSATPIPRTLNMAMSGIRDISTLETPPENRIPIQTYVTELTDALIRDVVMRELARGGQVFILYNRVQTIESFANKIQQIVPEANIVIGHGQMDSITMERSVNKFFNKEANVLICTTIIENGIDLPDANTIIVCDADKFGLSTLYQLRGRVGRSNKIAYAYFTYKDNRVLSGNAVKRLTAIMEYTEFGSGFKIAMRDLEIRGAGNILGREQHGHIAKIGYDLYCKLLNETVSSLNGEVVAKTSNVEVKANVDAYIEDSYISSGNDKIRVFKEIAEIRNDEDKNTLLKTLEESYGKPPKAVLALVDIGFIKNLASALKVTNITINVGGMSMAFEDNSCFVNSDLMFVVSQYSKDCYLADTKPPTLLFNVKNLSNNAKLTFLLEFLRKSNRIV
ncbi:MAG: transcription-repair coupling factor [Clostridia bacterium]